MSTIQDPRNKFQDPRNELFGLDLGFWILVLMLRRLQLVRFCLWLKMTLRPFQRKASW